MLPLEGITVISLEQAVAAPFATRQLADLGARVIKVERPGVGDFARKYDSTVNGMSSHFVWINRSKESIALDLKEEEGKMVLNSLFEKADVFIHNLAPGAVNRLGFSAEKLQERFPRLINCSISGYGTGGSYQDKKAYDLLIQCEAGLVSITGTEEEPSKSGISIADIAAGMYAYTGILTALIAREKSGRGAVLEISMLEALGEWMGYPMYYSTYGGVEPSRSGARHATIYPYGPFQVENDKSVFLSIQNEREWAQFCNCLLEDEALITDRRFQNNTLRVKNQAALKSIIDAKFENLSSEEAIEKLEDAKIANARLNSLEEFVNHEQLKVRDRWREVDSPVGKIKALIPPVTTKDFSYVMNPIPEVGEHTLKILNELGLENLNPIKQ
ncbi:CaiB/BaiF CoA transferase family protein [Peribacillus butanolivorans]|uniref:CaiB/BaiF CoA transferase family protein n=1 Tax=Peribacillus butanolivorans TaxID=421767 RepID=UPI0035DCBBB6